ncbi:hypothetical protein CMT52_16925, partial [Elizabethkingia anophelis]|nr:hypothetical protein [Elizabethkingia anophelis]
MKTFEVRIFSPENLNNRWYVYIYDTSSQQIVYKYYKGINSHSTYQDRMLRCEVIKESLEKELKHGLVPSKTKTVKTENKTFP